MKSFIILLAWVFSIHTTAPINTTSLKVTSVEMACPEASNGYFEVAIDYQPDFVFPAELIISKGGQEFENGFLPVGEYCLSLTNGKGDTVVEVCQQIVEGSEARCAEKK
ncbi:MAG: hypothetical protein AAF990_12965 [Bacteroidota bacterium]